MRQYALDFMTDSELLQSLSELVARDRRTTAELLAHLAEVDARRLYAPAGYPSMFAYCVGSLRFSEDAAGRRIHAARATRRFPELLDALESGALHLTAVSLLAAHLTKENVENLITAATHRGKTEIEALLARMGAPSPTTPTCTIRPVVPRPDEHALAHTAPDMFRTGQSSQAAEEREQATEEVESEASATDKPNEYALAHTDEPVAIPNQSFSVRLTISKSVHDKLRLAQALLSHTIPSGDVVQVLERALDSLISDVERRRIGGLRASHQKRPAKARRTVPVEVRRAVWERDGGR